MRPGGLHLCVGRLYLSQPLCSPLLLGPSSVLSYCYDADTMAKATYRDEGFIWMYGSMRMRVHRRHRGEHGGENRKLNAEGSHFESQLGRREHMGNGGKCLKPLKHAPRDILPLARPHLPNFRNSTTSWGPSIQMPETIRDISFIPPQGS